MSQGEFSNTYNAEDLTAEKRAQIKSQIEQQLSTSRSLAAREKKVD